MSSNYKSVHTPKDFRSLLPTNIFFQMWKTNQQKQWLFLKQFTIFPVTVELFSGLEIKMMPDKITAGGAHLSLAIWGHLNGWTHIQSLSFTFASLIFNFPTSCFVQLEYFIYFPNKSIKQLHFILCNLKCYKITWKAKYFLRFITTEENEHNCLSFSRKNIQ